jgi:CRP-like cAMP-binding protein
MPHPEVDLARERPDLAGTFIDGLPVEVKAALLDGSVSFARRSGALVFDVDDPQPHVGLMLSGTARSFITAADGRQLTVRYARRGAIIGKRSDLSGDHAPVSVRAVTACHVLELDVAQLSRLVETEVMVALAVLSELTGRLEEVYATIADSAFGSVRQRVVRHLLALADDADESKRNVVRVTQQQLADGIGSSREVVARELAHLRGEHVVQTGDGSIEILDRDRLTSFLGGWRRQIRVPIPGAPGASDRD